MDPGKALARLALVGINKPIITTVVALKEVIFVHVSVFPLQSTFIKSDLLTALLSLYQATPNFESFLAIVRGILPGGQFSLEI